MSGTGEIFISGAVMTFLGRKILIVVANKKTISSLITVGIWLKALILAVFEDFLHILIMIYEETLFSGTVGSGLIYIILLTFARPFIILFFHFFSKSTQLFATKFQGNFSDNREHQINEMVSGLL